ncbi:MAG: hypothetical protein ETSY2_18795 [Candidatus Entotheonella gemina]|uniref:Uncharacterized protein n=1 Tax=Candidatus Entotheonella gemina TaxID=1429439 RepID=W4M8B2_9BACT|nr:MAG: hypothetical protein ETSY2_18795 [Candidatus Entotheonella gemina]
MTAFNLFVCDRLSDQQIDDLRLEIIGIGIEIDFNCGEAVMDEHLSNSGQVDAFL